MSNIVLNGYDMFFLSPNTVLIGVLANVTSATHTATEVHISNGERTLVLGGTFGGFDASGLPTTGTVTSASWDAGAITITGLSISVPAARNWVATSDYAAMESALMGGADTIVGSAASERIFGWLGSDTIDAGGGDDSIRVWAGEGPDSIDGGGGSDFLELEMSSPFFNFASENLRYTFSLPAMSSSAGYTLADGTVVSGVEAFHITGGNLADTFILGGPAVDNDFAELNGGDGIDLLRADFSTSTESITLYPFIGSTTGVFQGYGLSFVERYAVQGGSAADQLIGGDFNDVLKGGGGKDVLRGNAGADALYGGSGDDNIVGHAGNDTLNGGAGHDVLKGGSGADRFVFDASILAADSDQLPDFSSAQGDKILLQNSVFNAIGGAGGLGAAKFFVGADAHDGSDRIIYNSATGGLYYDADGNGAGAKVLIATLSGHPALTASDIVVI